MTTCGHCEKTIETPKQGQRFCSANCRAAAHRLQGKSAPGSIQSVHPRGDGGCTLVVRVPADDSARARAWLPGQAVELLETDQ